MSAPSKLGVLALIGTLLLTGCQTSGQSREELEAEVDYLRQELLDLRDQINSEDVEVPVTEATEVASTPEAKPEDEQETKSFENSNQTQQLSFIQINSPQQNSIFYEDPIFVHGSTSGDCYKIVATYNGSFGQQDVYTLQNYSLGDTTYRYGISFDWNNLTPGENNYVFEANCDGGVKQASLTLYYEPSGGGVEMGKPVIYLYPEQTQDVSVKASPEKGLTIVEPLLTKAGTWEVTATPESKITNKSDGSTWDYLFWEGIADIQTPETGFVVESKNLEKFFTEKLKELGLNKQETADFLEFWIPEINNKKHEKVVISFVGEDELNKRAPLTIAPQPETLIRVYFDYRPYQEGEVVKEQTLPKAKERNGFTVVEWGGTLR